MDINRNPANGSDNQTTGATSTSIKLQDPAADVKARVPIAIVPTLVWRLFGLKAFDLKALPGYDDINIFFLAKPEHDNGNIREIRADGYVLKILNSLQSADPTIVEAQHAFQRYVRERGIPTQGVVLNRKGQEWCTETFPSSTNRGPNFDLYIVRVVTYIPGEIFHMTPYVPGSLYNVGMFVGRLHKAVKGFHHSFYDNYKTIWSLTQIPHIRAFIDAVPDVDDRSLVCDVLGAFDVKVVTMYDQFQKAIIHGDLNEQNILMTEVPGQNETPIEERVYDVTGILDFADSNSAYLVMDVAMCIAYLSIDNSPDTQLDVGGHILAGYRKHMSLNEAEVGSMKTLICARLCQSLVFGAHTFMMQPENTYVLTTAARGWPLLRKIWSTDKEVLFRRWDEIYKAYSEIS